MATRLPEPVSTLSRWLFCVANLPTDDPEARMRVLRTLEALGAAVLREGVYALPDTPANRQALKPLIDYIAKGGTLVHLLEVGCGSQAQDQAFRRLFDRTARYVELIKVVDSLKIGYGISDPGAIARVLNKQRREFESIGTLDFFPNQTRERAGKVLAEAEAAVNRMLFPPQNRPGVDPGEALVRRLWATRKPLWADRLACAWLIRRFVDPEGRVSFLEKRQLAPYRGDRLRLRGRAVSEQRHARDLRGDARAAGICRQSRARQDRRHRPLPRGAAAPGARGRRRADPAAGRAAPRGQRG